MKNTRSLLTVLILAVLPLPLCACGGSPDYQQVKLDNRQSGVSLTLGMDRAAVDELLAKDADWDEQTERDGLCYVDYDGGESGPVTAWFQDDQAVYFAVGDNSFPQSTEIGTSSWSVSGITLGSSGEEVEDALGFPTVRNGDIESDKDTPFYQMLSYKYLSDGTLLAADTGDESFTASFLLQEGKVVLFGVYSAGYDLSISDNAVQEVATQEPTPITSPLGYGLTIPAGCTYEPLEDPYGLRVLRDGQAICGLIYLTFPDPQRLAGEGFTHPDFVKLLQLILGEDTNISNYVFTSSDYGSFQMELEPDGTCHHFFPGEDCFYDLWVQEDSLTPDEARSFLSSFYLDS